MTVGELNQFHKIIFLTLFILTVLVVAASYLLVLLMGYGFVFFTAEGISLSNQSFNFYVLLFFMTGFYIRIEAGVVFMLIWIVYVLCFIAAWKWRESFHTVIGKSFSGPMSSVFSNFLFIMPLLSSMLFAAVSAIFYIQEFVGVPAGEISWSKGTLIQLIFLNSAYAPVAEEVGFRIIPMGLFTFLYVSLSEKRVAGRGGRLKLLITSLFYPERAKKMAGLRNVSKHGVWRGINSVEWAMILVTSVIFGFAHLVSGIGWEIGKITLAFVPGVFFALTYLAYGFEAPILLHWFFNYYLFFFDSDILSRFFPTTDSILSLIELIILALGTIGWIVFAVAGLRKLLRSKTIKHEAPSITLP